jgi:hypothetical protein
MSEELLATEDYAPPLEQRRLRVITDQQGFRHVLCGQTTIASDTDDQVAAMARHVMAMPARPTSVAWIGAGLCIGPRIARGRVRDRQDVYEIREALGRFCPNYATFILGDWHDTLTGQYDVIVYDLADLSNNDRDRLTMHLAAGGVLLGG